MAKKVKKTCSFKKDVSYAEAKDILKGGSTDIVELAAAYIAVQNVIDDMTALASEINKTISDVDAFKNSFLDNSVVLVTNKNKTISLELSQTKGRSTFEIDESKLDVNSLPSGVVTTRVCFNKAALKKLYLGGQLSPQNASACELKPGELGPVFIKTSISPAEKE